MGIWLFWLMVGGILYVYVGFPLLLWLRSLWQRPIRCGEDTPRVSLVVVAHNEAAVIGDKLENMLRLDYPRERLEIVVACDGSDDGTDAIVARYQDRGVRLRVFPRRGKIPALNDTVAQTSGSVLVFSDANSMYDPDALRALVRPFADPHVGCVAGNQCYRDDEAGGAAGVGERLYWAFDRQLKLWQSKAGNIIGATGAMYAIRRELFVPIPMGVSDDFTISTGAIRRGQRLVFEPSAIAREPVASSDGAEFRRKTRITARGLRTMWYSRDLFNPLRFGFYAVQIASHKLLRWSVCWMLLILLVASLLVFDEGPVYRLAVLAQLTVYGLALAGMAIKDTALARMRIAKPLAIPYYFCLANIACFWAWAQILRGRRVDVWSSQRQPAAVGLEAEAGT